MFAFKEMLERALFSTRERFEVFRYIQRTAVQSGPEWYAILHFLAVESQWLRRPPLQFLPVREIIGARALEVALDVTHSKKRRFHALLILRAADKSRFGLHFRDLFLASAASERLLGQLLHGAYTFLARPYHRSDKMLGPLRSSLQTVVEDLAEHPDLVSSAVGETVRELNAMVELHIAHAGVRFLSPQEAWSRLRRTLLAVHGTSHHEVAKHLRQMHPMDFRETIQKAVSLRSQGDLGDFLGPAEKQFIQLIPEHWQVVARFIDHHILPPFSRLVEIFQQEDAENALNYDGRRFLVDLSRERQPLRKIRLSRQIETYRIAPERILERTNWAELEQMIELLRTQIIGGPTTSSLEEFVGSVPTDVWSNVREVLREKRTSLEGRRMTGFDDLPTGPSRVFAPSGLVKDIFAEVLQNVVDKVDDPEGVQEVWLRHSSTGQKIVLTVTNTNSSPRKGRGQQIGLQRLRARLIAFGGDILTSTRPPEPTATFEVVIHIPLWGAE
jgi:hypothetical protein